MFLEETADESAEGVVLEEAPLEGPDAYVGAEDEEAPFFAFDDDDVAYGDPAEPPYEDDAVTDEPEETIIDTTDPF